MANAVNVFSLTTEQLSTFLAKSVSDGTYADVIGTLKTDSPGLEAPATGIATASGQLLSNLVDDYIQASYPAVQNVAIGMESGLGYFVLNGVGYVWPAADGTSGYVLSTNGAGVLSWIAAGGGTAETLAQTLAAGDVTGGNDIVVEQPDRVVYATSLNGFAFEAGRHGTITSGGAGAVEEIGAALHTADSTTSNGDHVTAHATGVIRVNDGGTVTTFDFEVKEVWTVDGGSSAVSRIDTAVGTAALASGEDYRVALVATNSGTVDSLFLTIDEGNSAGVTLEVFAKVTVCVARGQTPA